MPETTKWTDSDNGLCVNKFAGEEVLANLEHTVDRFSKPGSQPTTTELVRESCHKQIYRRRGFRIVSYMAAGYTAVVHGSAEPEPAGERSVQAAECLARARKDLASIPTGADTLQAYQKKFMDVADDADIGPAHFLNCSGSGNLSYQDSMVVMVHELTHLNTTGQCLYTSYAPGHLCFALPADLPSSSIATLDDLFDTDDPYLKSLRRAQQLYLMEFGSLNRGPLALFDELNAYTAGMEISAALLQEGGPTGVLDKDGHPKPDVLPLVMLWTVQYLERLRDQDLNQYSSVFGPATQNRKNLEILLAHGQGAYEKWIAQLRQHHLSVATSEGDLWRQYLEAKKQLDDLAAGTERGAQIAE